MPCIASTALFDTGSVTGTCLHVPSPPAVRHSVAGSEPYLGATQVWDWARNPLGIPECDRVAQDAAGPANATDIATVNSPSVPVTAVHLIFIRPPWYSRPATCPPIDRTRSLAQDVPASLTGFQKGR